VATSCRRGNTRTRVTYCTANVANRASYFSKKQYYVDAQKFHIICAYHIIIFLRGTSESSGCGAGVCRLATTTMRLNWRYALFVKYPTALPPQGKPRTTDHETSNTTYWSHVNAVSGPRNYRQNRKPMRSQTSRSKFHRTSFF